jgi:hypothetical protein
MEKHNPITTISKETAWQLCAEIRRENQGKWYTINGLWCWGCEKFSHRDPAKMCFANSPTYRGCAQVNARYDRQSQFSRA